MDEKQLEERVEALEGKLAELLGGLKTLAIAVAADHELLARTIEALTHRRLARRDQREAN